MSYRIGCVGLACVFVAACGSGEGREGASLEQSIVRGEEEGGLQSVLMIHSETPAGLRRCSATYIAPRVALTAAHCIAPNAFANRFFVYHGEDYASDLPLLTNVPPPGAPSPWARAESWTVHPYYSPELNYPDLAIVYLDRELPFEPMRIHPGKVGRPWEGELATIAGWGASRALSADITQVEGVGVKRSGQSRIVGSPTEADFRSDDPNLGLLFPEIRRDLLKLEGSAPLANPCAGDSGGPLILQKNGCASLAGVGMWTGLFCEEYSVFTRIDPFRNFVHESLERAGRARIMPRLECVAERPNGELTAYFGYRNENGLTVTIGLDGGANSFPGDVENERPSEFAPGDHPWVFGVDFSAGERLEYRLSPRFGPTTVLHVDSNADRCDSDDIRLTCANQCRSSFEAPCSNFEVDLESCVNECVGLSDFFGQFDCAEPFNDYLQCIAELSPDPSHWLCFEGFVPQPASPHCDEELLETLACSGF